MTNPTCKDCPDRNELIVHPRTNQYIILENIGTEDAIKAKVLEWLSRAAFKTAPYSQEWRNRKFHKYMRDGINAFLDTDFSAWGLPVTVG